MRNIFFKQLRFKPEPSQTEEGIDQDDKEAPKTAESSITVCDNAMVEDRLGHLGILCIEDVMDEVNQKEKQSLLCSTCLYYQ